MTGPAIFQPGDPSVSANPIFNPNQNVATGMPTIPGQFAGAAGALSQLVQLQQSQKDQALGQLARVHAAIDAGIYPQSVMDTPEVQALFPKAGLDALQHQALLPKNSDAIAQQKAAELSSPIFSGPDAVGGAGSRAITGLPQQGGLNVENQAANDTNNPNVARVVGKLPVPAAADIGAQTAPVVAGNELAGAKIDTNKLKLASKAVDDGEKLYGTDKQFHAFVVDLQAGVLEPYTQALKQTIASLGLEKQAQGSASNLLGQAITSAPADYQAEHKDWLDQQSKERATFTQSLQMSTKSEDDQATAVQDHMIQWNSQHHEPTLEGIVTRNFSVNAAALGMTPQQAAGLLKQITHIESPGQKPLTTKPLTGTGNRAAVIGSIIEQAKHDPQHITFDPGDGKGPITVSLTQLYTDAKTPLVKSEIDHIRQSLSGKNPSFNANAGAGQGGGNKRPVNPVASPTQVP